MRFPFNAIAATTALAVLSQCSTSTTTNIRNADVVVSVKDQKLGIYRAGHLVSSYKVSTSKFGIGDQPGSNRTPLGKCEVVAKIGHGLPAGAVLKSRQWNGEVLRPNAPGRDPIVSRILWLSGQESTTRNAYNRFIYIHGTTEEFRLGSPASYGCVRMAARDVINVFDTVPIGASVVITKEALPVNEAGTEGRPVQLTPPLSTPTPASSPAEQPGQKKVYMPVPLAEGATGPAPVLVTRSAPSPEAPAAVAPVVAPKKKTVQPTVAAAPVQPDAPAKRNLLGFKKSAPAPQPVQPVAAALQKSRQPVPAQTAAVVESKPASKRRFFGLVGGQATPEPAPAPAPVVATAPAPAKAKNGRVGNPVPKVTNTGKPVASEDAPKTTGSKKRTVKKVAGDSTDSSVISDPVSGSSSRARSAPRPA